MGSNFVLTPRDKLILKDLCSYGLLSTNRLRVAHFPGTDHSTVLRRLRKLWAAGFTQRIPDLNTGNAWGLTRLGANVINADSAKVHFPRAIQEHDLKLTLLRIRLEEAGIARFWSPEHTIRRKIAARCGRTHMSGQNIPDGLFGVQTKEFPESVALELELTSKNQTRYGSIFRDYLGKKHLSAFWYVVGKPTIGKQLETASRSNRYRKVEPPYFYWSLLEEVMADPLNALVHREEGSVRLQEIWLPAMPLPAQDMGTLEGNVRAHTQALSPQNEMQIGKAL